MDNGRIIDGAPCKIQHRDPRHCVACSKGAPFSSLTRHWSNELGSILCTGPAFVGPWTPIGGRQDTGHHHSNDLSDAVRGIWSETLLGSDDGSCVGVVRSASQHQQWKTLVWISSTVTPQFNPSSANGDDFTLLLASTPIGPLSMSVDGLNDISNVPPTMKRAYRNVHTR